jgi:hypothetical protein
LEKGLAEIYQQENWDKGKAYAHSHVGGVERPC